MQPVRLMQMPVTIRPAIDGPRDTYGNSTRAFTDPVFVEGYVEYVSSDEVMLDRLTVRTHWRAFLPAGTAVTPRDRIEWNGHTFTLEGLPREVVNPLVGNTVSHVECALVETT